MNKIISFFCVSALVFICLAQTTVQANAQSVEINATKDMILQSNQSVSADFTKDTMPRIDGSTATIPLSEGLAMELLGMNQTEAKQYIKHNTTHAAYENLASGKCDVIFVTPPAENELNVQIGSYVPRLELNQMEIIPVVNDAFVFLVNDKNNVSSLTIEQIQNIYRGKIKDWNLVGGENISIKAFQRPDLSGSQTLFYQFIMPKEQLMKAPTDLMVQSMGGLVESVSNYNGAKGAIGYSVYYYAKEMYPGDHSKLLAINGIMPTDETIMKGEYPFVSPYYAVIRKNSPKDSPERKLISYLLSEDGQKLAKECGYVPKSIIAQR